jgi:hypothetical protein
MMHILLRSSAWVAFAVFSLGVSTSSYAQQDVSAIALRLTGADGAEVKVTADDWTKLPRATIKAVDHQGVQVSFEGVPVREVLQLVRAPEGKQLRGKNLSLYLVAEGADGYRVLYALPELDPDFTDGVILIADRKDGQALSLKEGPLRIVVPWEKREARWLRQLVTLTLGRAP